MDENKTYEAEVVNNEEAAEESSKGWGIGLIVAGILTLGVAALAVKGGVDVYKELKAKAVEKKALAEQAKAAAEANED